MSSNPEVPSSVSGGLVVPPMAVMAEAIMVLMDHGIGYERTTAAIAARSEEERARLLLLALRDIDRLKLADADRVRVEAGVEAALAVLGTRTDVRGAAPDER